MRHVRSVTPMRIAKTGCVVVSVLMCVLGISLIAVPGFSLGLLCTICGMLMILFGLVRLVGYFSRDLYRLAFQYDLAFGILLVALGILTLANPGSVMTIICIALGLSILADSIFKIQIAFDSKKFGIRAWWLILVFAVLAGLFGLLLMFRPGESSHILAVVLGVTLLLEGSLNLSTVLTAVKIIKHQKPDVIEVDYYEESGE